jgi:hypothetical protein
MKKWGLALKETIFQLAVLHLLMIGVQAIRSGDFQLVHLASILDLRFVLEDVSYSISSNLLFYVPIVLLFLVNFALLSRKKSPSQKG